MNQDDKKTPSNNVRRSDQDVLGLRKLRHDPRLSLAANSAARALLLVATQLALGCAVKPS